jgi:hypothetical protein
MYTESKKLEKEGQNSEVRFTNNVLETAVIASFRHFRFFIKNYLGIISTFTQIDLSELQKNLLNPDSL